MFLSHREFKIVLCMYVIGLLSFYTDPLIQKDIYINKFNLEPDINKKNFTQTGNRVSIV